MLEGYVVDGLKLIGGIGGVFIVVLVLLLAWRK